jgi:lysophospholipase L1-like esterase
MIHVVLLGDSILDNGAYVGTGPAVIDQLAAGLPAGSRATLGAIDGSVTRDVARQLRTLPSDATHLVVSVGGNDALGQSAVLEAPARSVAEAVARLATIRDEFASAYRHMLDAVAERGLPTAICTIYDPRFPDPERQRLAVTGLSLFNDIITREAFARSLALVDLRLICNDDEDYANPIEPSSAGGAKIVNAILAFIHRSDQGWHGSVVIAD